MSEKALFWERPADGGLWHQVRTQGLLTGQGIYKAEKKGRGKKKTFW